MSPELEKHILLALLQQTQDSAAPKSGRRRLISVLAAIAVVSTMYYCFHVYKELSASHMLAVLAGAAVGAVLAFGVSAEFFSERIAVILRVIDPNLIRTRLRELRA